MRPEFKNLIGGVAFGLALSSPTGAQSSHPYISDGYREAVFSVSDLDEQAAFYRSVAGWDVLHRGEVSPSLLAVYAPGDGLVATEVVLGNPGTERGFLRLIEFQGSAQQQIRSSAQSWDTGGFFDVNARVLDMEGRFAEFQSHDWQAASDPVQFTFGPFVVNEWLTRGPDGVVLALIERVQPPLEGWPHLKELSRLFNATQVVTDAEAARRFYVDKLGFTVYLEHTAASERPEQNVLGLPHNLATTIPRTVHVVHPNGTNEGSIEILAFDGATGADFSDRVHPPNLGILTLRFPLSDMDGFFAHVRAEEIKVLIPPVAVELPPYGNVRLMAIRGPGGVWLEFFAALEQ